MKQITVAHAGKTYTVALREAGGASLRGHVEISVDGVWAGNGAVSVTGRIEDCAAVLDEGAYEAIEAVLSA